jgi:predicted TIM-barrel fold metal-dependent hydrolase
MVVDFHTHVFPPRIRQNRNRYVESDPCFAMLYAKKEAKLITAEELVESMDWAGVDISVILNIGWVTHELCVQSNDYILESIARYPKRLVGFCSVQPLSISSAISEVERCARGGARGIGELRPDVQLLNLTDDEIIKPFVEVLRKHRLVLLTHASEPVGHDYPGKGLVTPEMLYPFLIRYPDLTVVCAHWGGGLPFYALMPEVNRAMQNVYFDTAASPFLYRPQIYEAVSQLVGADRILFGSDYPLLPQARLLQEIKAAEIPDDAKHLITGGNAERLLGL